MHFRFISNHDSHDLYFDELQFGLRRTMLKIFPVMLIEAYETTFLFLEQHQTNM